VVVVVVVAGNLGIRETSCRHLHQLRSRDRRTESERNRQTHRARTPITLVRGAGAARRCTELYERKDDGTAALAWLAT